MKLNLSFDENSLKEAIYSIKLEEKLYNRKMYLRGFTNIKQLTCLSRVIQSKNKVSKDLASFT